MRFSVVIPAHNEEASIGPTVTSVAEELAAAQIDYEIVVVDDASRDRTAERVAEFAAADPRVRCVRSHLPAASGSPSAQDWTTTQATRSRSSWPDLSDSPRDVVAYYRALQEGYDYL